MNETWVVKTGYEYVHSWSIGTWAEIKDVKTTTAQNLAYRFDRRNYASEICCKIQPKLAGSLKVVRLTSKPARVPDAARCNEWESEVGFHIRCLLDEGHDGDCSFGMRKW